MDGEALAQQFVAQTESADAEHVASQRAAASGEFGAYWEQTGREAIERMEKRDGSSETG